jgi:hypothetical protein
MRSRRKSAAARLTPLTDAQLCIGTGWNWLTPDEEAELRRVWIEIGDEFTAQKRAKYGDPNFEPWAWLMFGSPADCAAGKPSKFDLQMEEESD